MATPVEAPKLGNSVEECLISRWVKRKGESVAAGDVVAEIETDKATFEVTSPVDGVLLESFFDEGALVPVFTNIFVVGVAGESAEAFRPGGETAPAQESVNQVVLPAARARADEKIVHSTGAMSPRARRFAKEHSFNPATVNGSGPAARILEQDLRKLYDSGRRISKVREKIARRMRESLASTAQYTLN